MTDSARLNEIRNALVRYRAAYMSHYRATLSMVAATAPKDAGPPLSEFLVHRSDDYEADDSFGLLRWDIVEFRGNARPLSVVLDSPTADAADLTVTWTGVQLTITPFNWHSCRIRMPGRPRWLGISRKGVPDATALTDAVRPWFEEWIDSADRGARAEDGWKHRIHSCATPIHCSTGLCLDLDLGSAPAEALENLFDICAGVGANPIHVEPVPSGARFQAVTVTVRDHRARSAHASSA